MQKDFNPTEFRYVVRNRAHSWARSLGYTCLLFAVLMPLSWCFAVYFNFVGQPTLSLVAFGSGFVFGLLAIPMAVLSRLLPDKCAGCGGNLEKRYSAVVDDQLSSLYSEFYICYVCRTQERKAARIRIT